MAGIDSNAKLVLHCNGSDASTSFPDASEFSHSPVANGNAQVDTAQSVFGGASALFDGAGDYISVPDSADWDFGTNDMAFDFRYRFNSLSGSQCWVGRPTSGSSYMYFAWEGGGIRIRDFSGGFDVNFGAIWTPVINTWYHIALTRDGNNWRFFVDGVQKGSTIVNSGSFLSRSVDLTIGSNPAINYHCNGWMDEVRISNGDSRWTANFTPPTSEYTSGVANQESFEDLEITDIIEITDTTEFLSDDLEITDSIIVLDTSIIETDDLEITDEISVTDTTLPLADALQITDSIILTSTNTDAKFASKIISINPLIFVTDTSPIEIIKVDTTDPQNLTWVVQSISGINSAKDITINGAKDYIYIGGDNGRVIKVEVADLANQTTIDLSDTDDVIAIEHNKNFGITYAGTDNNVGELYTIDERTTFKLDTDFTCLSPQQFKIPTVFNIIDIFKLDSSFTALSDVTFKIKTDFKCLTKELVPITSIDDIVPINLKDYQVFIDGNELEDTDLILDSISIIHSVDEESQATFRLSRQHDNLDITLGGISSQITNQNTVEIKVRGVTIFPYNGEGTGHISELDCQYLDDNEYVIVSALSEEAINVFNSVTMSLPGVADRLSIYDILVQNPKIYNPYVDSNNEDNPKKYKGIRVSLGNTVTQSIIRYTINDTRGEIAEQIQDGSFISLQNWTYFWVDIDARKFSPVTSDDLNSQKQPEDSLGGIAGRTFFYIGTSISPVSEDLWDLNTVGYHKQRIYDDIILKLGYGVYTVNDLDGIVDNPSNIHSQLNTSGFLLGNTITTKFKETTDSDVLELSGVTSNEQTDVYQAMERALGYVVGDAPFQDISVRNGQLITKPKLVDEDDGLYSVKDDSNDFTEYAKEVADLEYEKLKNINGDILPDTSCTLNLTIDAYLYYQISLLTKINIDNTTNKGIYDNNNGFPVSTKSINITSSNRRVSIEADNTKSAKELEVINFKFPDEDDDEYNEKGHDVLISTKRSMKTGLEVK